MIRRLLAISLFAVAATCSHAQPSLPSSFQAKTIDSPVVADIFVRWGGREPVVFHSRICGKFAVLRYVPNPLSDVSMPFGVLGYEVDTGTFASTKFLQLWEPILRIDPKADIELLETLANEIQNEWPDVQKRAILLKMFVNSFSNSVQVQETSCLTADPKREMDTLAFRYLGNEALE
jgi:hypothetical protein